MRLISLDKAQTLQEINGSELNSDSIVHSIKSDIVRVITQNVLQVLSDVDESALLKNKICNIQSKKQKSGGYFSFDFDSIPDFEPIDRYVEMLKSQQYDISTIEKLLNVDVEDIFENHLWIELLSSLESALILLGKRGSVEDVDLCLSILALYYRFMQAFKSHPQGLDAINSYLRYLSQQWSRKVQLIAPTLLTISQYALFVRAIDTFSHHSACTCEKEADEVICRAFLLLSRGTLSLDDGKTYQPVLHVMCRVNGSCNFLQQLTRRCHPMSVLNHALSTGLLRVLIQSMESPRSDQDLAMTQTFFSSAFVFSIFDSVIGNLGLVAVCYKVCSDLGTSLSSELPCDKGLVEYNGDIGDTISIVPVPRTNKRFCNIQNTVSLVDIVIASSSSSSTRVEEFDSIFAHILAMLPTRNSLMLQLATAAADDSVFSNMATVITFLLRVPAILYAEIDQCSSINMIFDIVVDILETTLTSSTNEYGIQIVLEGFVYGVECCLECLDGLVSVSSASRVMYGVKRLLKAILSVEQYSCKSLEAGQRPQGVSNDVVKLYLLVSRSTAVSEIVTGHHASDFAEFFSSLTSVFITTMITVEEMLLKLQEGGSAYSNSSTTLCDLVLLLVTVCNSSFIAQIGNTKSIREELLDIFIECLLVSSKPSFAIIEESYVLQAMLRLIVVDVEGFRPSAKSAARVQQAIIDEAKSMYVYDEALEWYGSGSASSFLSIFQLMTGMCAVGVQDQVLSWWVQAFVEVNAIDASQGHELLELVCTDVSCLEMLSSCGLYPYFLRLLNICYYDFQYSVMYGMRVPDPDSRTWQSSVQSEESDEEGVAVSWDLTAVFRSIIHAKATCDITHGTCNAALSHGLIAQSEQDLTNWDDHIALAMGSSSSSSQSYNWDLNLGKYDHLSRVLSWWRPGISSLPSWRSVVTDSISSVESDRLAVPVMGCASIYYSNEAFQYIVSRLQHVGTEESGVQLRFPAPPPSWSNVKGSVKRVNFFAVSVCMLCGGDEDLFSKVIDAVKLSTAMRILVDAADGIGQPNLIQDKIRDMVSDTLSKSSSSASSLAVLRSIGVPLAAAVDFVARSWFFNSLCIEDVVVVTAVTVLQGDLTFPEGSRSSYGRFNFNLLVSTNYCHG
eukprot:gene26006-34607_t